MELNCPLKKVGDRFDVAREGDEIYGFYAGSVDERSFIMQVEARQGVVYASFPAAALICVEESCLE